MLASFAWLMTAIGFQLQERVTAIVSVSMGECVHGCVCVLERQRVRESVRFWCVCVCDLSRQVTGIRVRGEDAWLQGDETQTHAQAIAQVALQWHTNEHSTVVGVHGHMRHNLTSHLKPMRKMLKKGLPCLSRTKQFPIISVIWLWHRLIILSTEWSLVALKNKQLTVRPISPKTTFISTSSSNW